jgi:pyrimidine operon attenuation protein/uracil phosphoribosyltransferase
MLDAIITHMKNPGPAKDASRNALPEKAQLMSSSEIDRTLVRLAHEIVERHNGAAGLVFVGILRRGVVLAERLAKRIAEIEKTTPPVGRLDITSYRDDLAPVDRKSIIQQSHLPFSMEDKDVVLVDDVLYTGRSTRAALDALVDHGRPRRVELCVLIDRGHRELPIQANYVGRVVQTSDTESVEVHLREVDREDRVVLCEKGSGI